MLFHHPVKYVLKCLKKSKQPAAEETLYFDRIITLLIIKNAEMKTKG